MIRPRDRSFLVDFNEKLTLAQPLTANTPDIHAALDALVPDGGTALYDSILRRIRGRRFARTNSLPSRRGW